MQRFTWLKTMSVIGTVALAGSLLTGCASTARDMLQEHQCMREASNRPDAIQRKAECQQRALRVPDSASEPLDA